MWGGAERAALFKGDRLLFLASKMLVRVLCAAMPRIPRGQVGGHAYHVLNRGNGGATVFHKDGDYAAFIDLLATAKAKFPVKVFSVCLMPNHFHLIVQPATEAALSPFMQWWMTSRAAIPPTLPKSWACVAGAVQELPDSAG
jgi:hypothetical protein